jgi:hypothetical protein
MADMPNVGVGSSRAVSRAPSQEDIKRPNLSVGEVGARGVENDGDDVTEGKQERVGGWRGVLGFLEKKGDVELRGCTPVPYEDRRETQYSKIFTLWFCMSCNPLP